MGPGDLCSVEFDEGEYRVVKVLAIGDGMVHVRLYVDRFGERPFQVDPARLDQGATDKYFGIPHLPVSVENFATWRPGAIGHEDVREHESRATRSGGRRTRLGSSADSSVDAKGHLPRGVDEDDPWRRAHRALHALAAVVVVALDRLELVGPGPLLVHADVVLAAGEIGAVLVVADEVARLADWS